MGQWNHTPKTIKTMILARATMFMLGLLLIMNIYPTYGGPIEPDDKEPVANVDTDISGADYQEHPFNCFGKKWKYDWDRGQWHWNRCTCFGPRPHGVGSIFRMDWTVCRFRRI